ncbi:MAG: N-acetylneuraminate synthase [Deltaproteobacteria bacterium]|nr:N-acetylneuraminate synthase [Deltaproteobacteria bacterium]
MAKTIDIGGRLIGDGQPVYIAAEIGINHNGDMDIAKRLIAASQVAGCDAVKFQKRTPDVCTPPAQRDLLRETPWGLITYLEYRYKVEFDKDKYNEIASYAKNQGIAWFASPWDEESVDFLEEFDVPAYKIPSACLTDKNLLKHIQKTGRPIVLSTGMSSMEQIREAVGFLGTDNLLLTHCTSTYPCKPDELNLKMLHTLREEFDCPVGYSGHEIGLQVTHAAVVLGACYIERHVTLDRSMWGSDHAASVEPWGIMRLVRDIRVIEQAMGDGVKKVYESEKPIIAKLRRVC